MEYESGAILTYRVNLCAQATYKAGPLLKCITLLLVCVLVLCANSPELPRTYIDSTYVARTGNILHVPVGGNLQAALNNAQPGDTVQLAAGAVYSGNFVLPPKLGNEWIYIETATTAGLLPPPGTRVGNGFGLARIVTPNSAPALYAAAGAHHYRLVGLEISTTATYTYNLLYFEGSDHITIDRCYIHGTPGQGLRRGVAANAASVAVIDSYFSDIHEVGADSQAICSWNSPGPLKIVNNFLSAAGENVMFGGALASPGVIPSDIEVRGNHFSKSLDWMGTKWTVKNLFELKSAQRVLVDGNILENNWQAAQNGTAVLFTVRAGGSSGEWAVVNDVTFTNNLLRNVDAGFALTGFDNNAPVGKQGESKRIRISNNLAILRTGAIRPFGAMFADDRMQDVTFDHNTLGTTPTTCWASIYFGSRGRLPVGVNIRISNNVLCTPPRGDGSDPGLNALTYYMPEPSPLESRFFGNVMPLYNGRTWPMPPNNTQVAKVEFANAENDDYSLLIGEAGVNMTTLRSATANVISGSSSTTLAVSSPNAPATPTPNPTPEPTPEPVSTPVPTPTTSPAPNQSSSPVPPEPTTFTPIDLTGHAQSDSTAVFTATLRHPNGASKQYLGYILFLPTPNVMSFQAQGSCLIEYNRISNGLRLIDDSGTGWIGPVEGVPLAPASQALSNNACSVNVSGSSAVVSDADMTITVPVTFKLASTTQVMGMFLQGADVNGSWTDFRQFGIWQLPAAKVIRPGPFVIGALPLMGGGSSNTSTITVGHSAGSDKLERVHILFSSAIVGQPACHLIYFAANNTIAIVNDSGEGLVGPVSLGSGLVTSLRCGVDTSRVVRSASTQTLNLQLPLTFNPSVFAGRKNVYVNVFDKYGLLTHWVATGTWTVQ
jgi:hypothetical protein